ncbi:MAG: tRNA (adenosine(37)-N6)-threonylcarbamoyltransferase complex transferase subunit TsaD [Gemmatimonadales bacterium]|nr:tRNA (adenosine(37)-N6)-threonylcarbamoyltransferase complex transferase subunit TsaD [Gemmatimonadales bacterium]
MRRVLGIETSCDETSAAVVTVDAAGAPRVAGLAILSQDVHRIFGGVVPELASRAHVTAIGPVVDRALAEAGCGLDDVDGIAVTRGPGLVGALLVGLMFGKALAWRRGVPLIGVHHLEGHLFAPRLEHPDLAPPFVALLVSGGHTLLLDVPAWGAYRVLGRTLDDAAGEAFDKAAKLLGLPYPGGPAVERLAREAEGPAPVTLPRSMLGELRHDGPQRYAFSFSGLKTALLRAVQASADVPRERAGLARAFQDAVVEVLAAKAAHAAAALGRPAIVAGGGVACNQALLAALAAAAPKGCHVVAASPRLNTDNAAMIAAAGAWRLARGERDGPALEPADTLPLPGLLAAAA